LVATADRCTLRDDRRADRRVVWPTSAGDRCRGAIARWFAEAVDAGPLPCRPCRQRTCEPGDFRCLTRISPAQVVEAAERALRAGQAYEKKRAINA
jgi:hypothetical protein